MKISEQDLLRLAETYHVQSHDKTSSLLQFCEDLIALAQEVEPLVWTDKLDSRVAKTPFGQYYIDYVNSRYFVGFGGDDFNEDDIAATNTLEEAKEAAQQDYAKRVRSGLKYGCGE